MEEKKCTAASLTEKTLTSTLLYDGRVVHLYRDTVRLPNGHETIREVIRHVGAVCAGAAAGCFFAGCFFGAAAGFFAEPVFFLDDEVAM